jgi:uncharacterized Zn finger protein
MPTSVRDGRHLHDSKVLVAERNALGTRKVVLACSECGHVHDERTARPGDPVAET